MNIFLDVTQLAGAGLNTGIQRVTRGVFTGFSATASPAVPVCWDSRSGSYRIEPRFFSRSEKKRTAWGRVVEYFSRPAGIALEEELQRGDLFIQTEVCGRAQAEALLALKQSRGLVLFTVFHDGFARLNPEWGTPERARAFDGFWPLCLGSDVILVASESARSQCETLLQREGGKGPRLVTVPFGIAGLRASGKPPASAALCIGSLEPRKNHGVLLEAIRILNGQGVDLNLTFVGRPVRHWPELAAEMKKAEGKCPGLTWKGSLDEAGLEACYASASFTVFPSLEEGFGFPVYESLIRGVPCVTSDHGAMAEAAREGGCLLVRGNAPAEWASALSRLASDPVLREELARQARDRSFPSWTDYAKAVLALADK